LDLLVFNQLSYRVLFGKNEMFLVALRTRSLFLEEGFQRNFDLSRDSYSDFDYLCALGFRLEDVFFDFFDLNILLRFINY